MLVLKRKLNESINLYAPGFGIVSIYVNKANDGFCSLAIEAPPEITILRSELGAKLDRARTAVNNGTISETSDQFDQEENHGHSNN